MYRLFPENYPLHHRPDLLCDGPDRVCNPLHPLPDLLCDGPDRVGDPLEPLSVPVALADHSLNAQRVVSSLDKRYAI